jgi:hypothetical protein
VKSTPITVVISSVMVTLRPEPSGLVNQSKAVSGTIAATMRPSQSLRRPSWSIDAPRNGAVAMMNQPEYWLQREMISWPFTESPTTVWATYGMKI